MKAQVTDAELVASLKLVEKYGDIAKASRASGYNRSYLNQRVLLARQRGLTATTPVLDDLAKAQFELKLAKRRIEQIQRDNDTADAIRQEIYGLSARDLEPPTWLHEPGKAGFRGCPTMIWSDWHAGEVVQPVDVAGMNEFNTEIMKTRAKRLVDTTIDLCYNHMGRAKTKYPGAVVMLGGDMLTGDIHEELRETNDRTPQEAIEELTDTLAASLDTMAGVFGHLFVPCVVGNHGRSTRKPRMKGRVFTSHEWNIYCNLKRHFRKSKHVQFLIPGETDAYFSIYGHRYLLTHGDSLGVKGGDGIIGALGPIVRGAFKVGRSEAQIGRDFDCVVMGHWHQYIPLQSIIVNNSFIGYNEYARLGLRAEYSRPSQALWFTHPEHGITARWEVYLEGKRTVDTSNKWVEWQHPK